MNGNAKNGLMLAILAAGKSRRFGDNDKLTALLQGKMLGLHATETLAALPFQHKVVISPKADHLCAEKWRAFGYQATVNERADQGQSTSVQLASEIAETAGASGICICLADMPFVTTDHIEELMASFENSVQAKVIASSDGKKPMPPAIFPAAQFDALQKLSGDHGAKSLLGDAQLIYISEHILTDIDTPEALRLANHKS